MQLLDQIKTKPTLILGLGREGQSTLNFLKNKFPHLPIATADRKDGPDYLKQLSNYQIIIKSPGISPHLPEIAKAKSEGKLITSQTQIFFEECPGKIIAVTGTKGKSTTASLIYHTLNQNNIPSVLVGNIGQPMLDYLPQITTKTWIVAELSSYQLMDLHTSPHIAVIQNIFPDHLDYHQSLAEYRRAKQNITKFQTTKDYLIYNHDNPAATKIASRTLAQTIPYSLKNPLLTLDSTNLTGQHNLYNAIPAFIIGKLLDIPQSQIMSAIKSFKMLEHRLELVATKNGIRFYSDPLATIPQASIAAIDALKPDVATLIAGGHERKQNYHSLAQAIIQNHIQTLILFPTTGERIWQEVKKLGRNSTRHFLVSSMEKAVTLAFKHTPQGKICLMSPAAPSFTLFKNYKDEHEQYTNCITQHPSS